MKHFSPYLIQSSKRACILTDSKPCVQAYEKLCRGQFSASPRVATFLSTVSQYQASVRHVAGSAILPSDFASRNPPECRDPTCQVCNFVQRMEDSIVRNTFCLVLRNCLSLAALLGCQFNLSVLIYAALMPI